MPPQILILGGTTEAREMAEIIGHCKKSEAVISLAGRTSSPAAFPIPVRVGGFGGVEGLIAYLNEYKIDLVVDATHPFATQMKANVIAACRQVQMPLIIFDRPAWKPVADDKWTIVPDAEAAVALLQSRRPSSVFLPLGQKELLRFEAVPKHRYLIRSIEKFATPLNVPRAHYIEARPPFEKAAEIELMRAYKIKLMVVKNSGASASYAKLVAARALGIEVVVIDRPPVADVPRCNSVAKTMAAVVHALELSF